MNINNTSADAFSPKIYQDEPIKRNAAQLASSFSPEYRAMRKLAYCSSDCPSSEAIFCKQGRFMADFEDNFDYRGVFSKYFPTYQDMNDQQLRGYFSWRTKIRRGIFAETSLSFAFVYIYELINQIGVKSLEEGFFALKNFWRDYKEIDSKIDRYCRLWLKDYAVYYNLDKSLLSDVSSVCFDCEISTLLNYRTHNEQELFAALNSISPYKLEESRFFNLHPEDVTNVVGKVYSALSDYYSRKHGGNGFEKLFGKFHSCAYRMFASAVFYERTRHQDAIYSINDFHRYACDNGGWSCERFLCYKGKIKQIGALLKNIDFMMRGKYGFQSPLKAEKSPKLHIAIIESEIDKYLEARRKRAALHIEIDISKLHSIREASLETQNRLIVEPAADCEVAKAASEPSHAEDECSLNGVERNFLRLMLRGESYESYLREAGLILSVLIDSISEKLFERFNDTPIVYDGNMPVLVEDYINDLKEMVKP